MARPLVLVLTHEQRAELEKARDTHLRPYMRERCAALLKVADGASGRAVALHRLLKPHWPDTIYEWIHRYRAEGLEGLRTRPGRFFPLSTARLPRHAMPCCTLCGKTPGYSGRTVTAGR